MNGTFPEILHSQSRKRLLASVLVFSWLGGAAMLVSAEEPATNPLDAQRAFGYLLQICDLGPRWSGSPGMAKQQELLEKHFSELGGKVSWQKFRVRNPETRRPVPMANLVVQWHPERKRRILLCAHYDTRPLPDRERPPRNKTGTFIGANDGGSGTAVLMELAHLMPTLEGRVGVDFVLFDGEELVYDDTRKDPYFLGSTWFAKQYVARPPDHHYRWGVLMDMVGDANLQIYQERYSFMWKDTRPLVREIWATAKRIGVDEFVARTRHVVKDDHLPLRNIANIPTCDIIDFDYPDYSKGNRFWHTEADRPERCSGQSLAKVGWVVYEWLRSQE